MSTWALASLGCVLAGLVGTACQRGGRDDRHTVAMVGNTPIYLDEFRRQLTRQRLESDDSGLPPQTTDEALKRSLLDDLIARRLLLQEAERRNVSVPSGAVEAAYLRMRQGWKDEEFTAQLRDKDMTPTELKNELRDVLTVRAYMRDFVFARVAVTDLEIELYVKAHPEVLEVPETVHARQLVVKTEEQANAIAQEIRRGLAFEDAAVKYSLSPDARTGGDLGFFARGVLPTAFDATPFGMRVGEVSGAIASPYGFHLFKLLERRPASLRTLAEVRDDIEARLRQGKEREAEAQTMASLRGAAPIIIKEDRLAQVL